MRSHRWTEVAHWPDPVRLLDGMVMDRLVWLRMRRTVIIRLLEGYSVTDIGQELLLMYMSLVAPSRLGNQPPHFVIMDPRRKS